MDGKCPDGNISSYWNNLHETVHIHHDPQRMKPKKPEFSSKAAGSLTFWLLGNVLAVIGWIFLKFGGSSRKFYHLNLMIPSSYISISMSIVF